MVCSMTLFDRGYEFNVKCSWPNTSLALNHYFLL